MGDLAGWSYWKVISITGQSGAGTDYQVELEIGDSAGGDFHLEGHCTNFPQDIRITDDDGTTLLDHWVEDITADPIVVHVEVKDDLGSNQDIRVYYGKSGETSASNGANTFIQYHGAASSSYLDSLIVTPSDIIFEALITSGSGVYDTRYGLSNNANFATDDSICIGDNSSNLYTPLSWNEGSATYDTNTSLATTTEYNLKFIVAGGVVTGYINDVSKGSISSGIADETMGLAIQDVSGSAPAQQWAFIRKYNSPEPAFSSAGAEQTPTGAAPTSVFYGPLVGPFGGPI